MSYTSKYTGNEIDELLDKITDKNQLLDSCFGVIRHGSPVTTGARIPFDLISGNMTVNEDEGTIVIKPGQRVQVDAVFNFEYTGNNYFCSARIALYDYTHEQKIGTIACVQNGEQYEYIGNAIHMQYTNETDYDCKIGLKVDANISGKTDAFSNSSHFSVFELGNIYNNNNQSNVTNSAPTGNIISFMGTKAPNGYLVCDGAELEISKYSKLAAHFEEQFGTKNHFGGNGTTTFAVPDLRNEFLRGYHANKEEQLSGEVGEHQDATNHNTFGAWGDQKYIFASYLNINKGEGEGLPPYGADTIDRWNNTYSFAGRKASTATDTPNWNDDQHFSHYTSRPTNVAVLYCIKY
jgi:hypothetical protein